MPDIRLGSRSNDLLHFEYERLEDSLRVLLVNADESGSMSGHIGKNVLAYDKIAAMIGGRADLVILHGFESDSRYDVIVSDTVRTRMPDVARLVPPWRGALHHAPTPEAAVRRGHEVLERHVASGSTNPLSHPTFLAELTAVLDALDGDVELVVINSSDGALDGGPRSPLTTAIERAMRLVTARCRCLLAANVLVGSKGSPEALGFFTGDPERYENRLLLSTLAPAKGVLLLEAVDELDFVLSDGTTDRYTVQPALPCWTVVDDALSSWHPEATQDLPRNVTVRRHVPKPGGRCLVMRADVALHHQDVTLERDGLAVFGLITRSLSDNPFLRETSRGLLNDLIAPLERLLATRAVVLAQLTASPEAVTRLEEHRARVALNTAEIRAVVERLDLAAREVASRVNLLNGARHLLKREVRASTEALEQAILEKEYRFYEDHPNHWLVWLQLAIETLKSQLVLTQVDPGDKVAHLSTRIRTAKSAADGNARAADRYVDRLLAESRSRRDRIARKSEPRDALPFERPGRWTAELCPASFRPVTDGLAAIPFVADRSDLTSGNLVSGGQNVDRMPIDNGPLFSMSAVRELMWGDLGQMASPYHNGCFWYNAAIPVLLGPASPDGIRDLERAIGWLATGTTAFAPQMAEAVPGALAVVLGDPLDPHRATQAQALLRTSALLSHFRSYPYAGATAAFDETGPKQPLPAVWAASVEACAGAACLQSLGCITSLFARAVAADPVEPTRVAADLFAWACRNLARSVLSTPSRDGRGGVEGIRRLAAALQCAVDLEEPPPRALPASHPAMDADYDGPVLDEAALDWILGDGLGWTGPAPLAAAEFTAALSAHMASLSSAPQAALIADLDGVFARLDHLLALDPLVRRVLAQPERSVVPHQGFEDVLALESLVPRRLTSPVPGLASPLARIRRMTKAGVTVWYPPADAGVVLNASAAAFVESHTAMYPVRAWLRLVEAGLVGQPALAALRARDDQPAIPAVPRVLPRLAEVLGGMDAVLTHLRRAFAFVVENAGGYADSAWATSPLRTAGARRLAEILGNAPEPMATPVTYSASDRLDLSVEGWPRMDPRGYLPKSRAVDAAGEVVRPPIPLPIAAVNESDDSVCQLASAAMLADLVGTGTFLCGGLHREARRVLGALPADLGTLDPAERQRVIVDELVPLLAGRIRGEVGHPDFFPNCASVLHQMVGLGIDTRTLRAEEPGELLAAEAAIIRSLALSAARPAS